MVITVWLEANGNKNVPPHQALTLYFNENIDMNIFFKVFEKIILLHKCPKIAT